MQLQQGESKILFMYFVFGCPGRGGGGSLFQPTYKPGNKLKLSHFYLHISLYSYKVWMQFTTGVQFPLTLTTLNPSKSIPLYWKILMDSGFQ